MNTNSNTYVMGFAVAMCVTVSAVLATLASALKETQQAAAEFDRQKNVMMAAGLIATPLDLMYNLTGVIIGLTQIFLPFMVLLLIPALQNIPPDVEAAAYTLKSSRPRVFLTITMPLATPGIITGSILVFVLSISALVTPRMLGGPTYKVMATQIYDEFMTNLDWPAGAALAFVLTVIALTLIWGANRIAAHFTKGFAA